MENNLLIIRKIKPKQGKIDFFAPHLSDSIRRAGLGACPFRDRPILGRQRRRPYRFMVATPLVGRDADPTNPKKSLNRRISNKKYRRKTHRPCPPRLLIGRCVWFFVGQAPLPAVFGDGAFWVGIFWVGAEADPTKLCGLVGGDTDPTIYGRHGGFPGKI